MSSTRQTVIRGPSFADFGKRPVFTPAHQVDLLTGMGPPGAKIDERRRKPVSGSMIESRIIHLSAAWCNKALLKEGCDVAEFGLGKTEFGFWNREQLQHVPVRRIWTGCGRPRV